MRLPHIGICVCTYKRPQALAGLLEKLAEQGTEGLFDYSITVADNDCSCSARHVVESCARLSKISISYCVEKEQNIARARNTAIVNCRGDYFAFIDDDELPGETWLVSLYKAMLLFGADGVLGPVKPHFEVKPPDWVLKGKFFERPMHESGSGLNWTDMRTGNAMVKGEIFQSPESYFDPAYGSGGEDRDFFRRMTAGGRYFVWCNEAPVYETVPAIRLRRSFMLRRALLRGQVAALRSGPLDIFVSSIASVAYAAILPILTIAGHHRFMKYLIKSFDHLGRVLSFFRIEVIKEKYITE